MSNHIKSLMEDGKDFMNFSEMQSSGIDKLYLWVRYPLMNENDMGIVIADSAEEAVDKLQKHVPSSGLDSLQFNVFSIFNVLNNPNRVFVKNKIYSWRLTDMHSEYGGIVFAKNIDDAILKVRNDESLMNDKDFQELVMYSNLLIEEIDISKMVHTISAYIE